MVRFGVAEFLQGVAIWHSLGSMPLFPQLEQRARTIVRGMLIWVPLASLLYLVRGHVGMIPTTGLEIYLLVLFFFATSVVGLRGWRAAIAEHPWRWVMVVWTLIGFISALYAPSIFSGLGLWRAYFLEPVLVAFLFPVFLSDEASRRRMKEAVCVAALIVSMWAIVQFLTGWGIPKPWNVSISAGRRATGPFPFPNAVALFLAPIVAWMSARYVAGRRDVFEKATALVGFIAIACARSDGGVIAVLGVLIGALLFQRVGRWILLVSTAGSAFMLTVVPRIATIVWKTLTFQQWSGKVRLFIWKETWQMLQAHPLLGAGLGGYPHVFAAFHKATFIEIFQYPHTILFNLWSEVGLVGIFVFVWLVSKWVYGAYQASPTCSHRWEITAPLVALLIQGLVDVPYFKNDLAILFWVFAFLVFAPALQRTTKR